MKKPKELNPVSIPREYFDLIEERIVLLLRTEVYGPLALELKQKKTIFNNSEDDLVQAIASGQIQYIGSHFEGSFSANISKELKKLGAEWDRSHGWWSIPRSKLTYDMRIAIGSSTSKFKKMAESIDKRLAKITPKEIADKLKIEHIFDATLFTVNKDFEKNVKNLTVAPKFTPEMQKRIAAEYTDNMRLYIKDFLQEEIKELRTQIVGVNTVNGFRYESMIKTIKDSYGVSQKKAKFLARQETNLLVTKFVQIRYEDAGVQKYKWRCVTGSPNHPVRPMHKKLDGTVHTWKNPPIVDENGKRANPGQDFQCFPADSEVNIAYGIKKCFRRWYTGKLTTLILSSGKTIRATPNHPILTTNGWKAIGSLNKGDQLVGISDETLNRIKTNIENSKPLIGDIFDSFSSDRLMLTTRGQKEQFHGDGTNNHVDIISTARDLSYWIKIIIFKNIKKLFFSSTNSFCFSESNFFINFFKMPSLTSFIRTDLLISESSSFGSFDQLNSAILFKPTNIIFRNGSSMNTRSFKGIGNRLSRYTDSIRNRFNRFSRFMGFDKCINIKSNSIMSRFSNPSIGFNTSSSKVLRKIIRTMADDSTNLSKRFTAIQKIDTIIESRVEDFNGHIYNLETESGWYIVNGLAVKNCRCKAIPIVEF